MLTTNPAPHGTGSRSRQWGTDCSRGRTRTFNLPVNSRTLCRLSYAGSSAGGPPYVGDLGYPIADAARPSESRRDQVRAVVRGGSTSAA